MADTKNDSTTAKTGDQLLDTGNAAADSRAETVAESGVDPEVDHDPARGYPQVVIPDAPGQDPDTLRRNEKHAVAAGILDPSHNDEDTVDEDEKDKDPKTDAAKARKAATPTRTTAPVNRSATPTQKAAE